MRIRRAVPADAPALAGLRYAFRAALGRPVEDEAAFLGRCAAWIGERLGASPWHCWVAEDADALAGQVWLQILEKVPNPVGEPECHGYVSNLFVQPPARGLGLGGRLLAAALECCDERSVDAVILWPSGPSRSLYLRAGFRPADSLLELRRPRAPE